MGDTLAQRRALDPDRPWRWREDWADARVRPHEDPSAVTGSPAGYWALGFLALGGSGLIALAIPAGEPLWPTGAVLWGLAALLGTFGLAGVALAVRRTRSRDEFGNVWLDLWTNPGVLGREFRATLRAARGFPPDAHASLFLVCSQRAGTDAFVTGHSTNLWEHSRDAAVANGAIPVEFELPLDLPESDPEIPDRATWCTWNLSVTVTSAAATLTNRFTVPVFRPETVGRSTHTG